MGILLEEKRQIPSFEYGLLTAMLNEAALVFARINLVSGRMERRNERKRMTNNKIVLKSLYDFNTGIFFFMRR